MATFASIVIGLLGVSCAGSPTEVDRADTSAEAATDAVESEVVADLGLIDSAPDTFETAADVADVMDTDATSTLSPYPDGPFGNKSGDLLANLTFQGYENPLGDTPASKLPFVSTSMDALRKTAPNGFALVHVSDFF